MELEEVLKNRRSYRKFTNDYIDDNSIIKLIEAASFAPSWANTQVWEFIVVRDKDLIKEITETYSITNPARECSFSASALIVVCSKQDISGCRDKKLRTRYKEWFMFDLGMAVQNLSLKAFDMGIGSVVVGSIQHEKCDELLDLPNSIKTVAVIPIGKIQDKILKVPKRRDLEDLIHKNKFNKKFL